MLDHAYQFSICKYEVLRIIENHPMREPNRIFIVKEVMTNEAIKKRTRMQKKADDYNK